ncbi:hypothetical protein FXV83_31030 [Bradyrhizobium hipponense]|uniref:Uncharacterized protein n=1 Tax=Bradyrhizobium hipponense TaxID=2605638 RepID=A0A5S4YQY5_9BRAD|nr:hypothetical protein [Bradyrhizobium hipponense]TYO62739.1 hypothetical protein FXV83_31030 [Bradyrhizobium hipponense]
MLAFDCAQTDGAPRIAVQHCRIPGLCPFAADLLDAAMAYRTDIVPFGSRVSTVHGVVFDFFAGRLTDPSTEGREGRLRIELNKRKGPVAIGERAFSVSGA